LARRPRVHSSEREAQEVELPFRDLADPCLLLVRRQLQLAHNLAHAIEWTIIPNRSTALLGFVAGKLDMTFPYEVTVPLLKDIEQQVPEAICELRPRGVSTTLIVNRKAPPFDNADLRRAMALSLDRRSFIDVLSGGQGDIGAAMLPPPEGLWGMPADRLRALPGYDPDVQKNRAEARRVMERLGHGPDNLLAVKVAARNIPLYRDLAGMLIDQLKEIYVAGELDLVETTNWNEKVTRRDYMVGIENTGGCHAQVRHAPLRATLVCSICGLTVHRGGAVGIVG
jgi:peptide/nickel transport system substrate-binding protein